MTADEVTGDDLIRRLDRPGGHPTRTTCPGCHEDVGADGLTVLLYAFEVCTCAFVDYEHLTETIWHQACYVKARAGVRYR